LTATQTGEIDFTLMYATHDAFRHDLERLARECAAGRADTGPVRAAWQNFTRQLRLHHTVEDTVLWPRVLAAVADRPQDTELMRQMEAEHALLDPVLAAVDTAMAEHSADLSDRLRELSTVLGDHTKHEEEAALPLIQSVLTTKDWDAFRRAMARRQGPRGAAVYVPWILDAARPADRPRILAAFPPPVRLLNRLRWEPRYQRRLPAGA
jgi:hypothetical protein